MGLIKNFIKILIKIDQKIIKNGPKMVPERSQMESRRPLESTWSSGTLPDAVSTAKLAQIWIQICLKID